jgi:hypothetical protein
VSGVTPSCCGECGRALRWERVAARDERWLAVCDCGMPSAFLPGRPDRAPADPLAEALGAGRTCRGASPPWIRVFQLTSRYPWWLPWRHVARACPGCRQRVTFAVWTWPRRDRCAYSTVCLACGRATSEYISTTPVASLGSSPSSQFPQGRAASRTPRTLPILPARGSR